ncbi:ABC transporter ATP-binding protein [Naumannella halotolerans]|uniref:ABC transporter ATP-binding protein n=1 Tax=Naumannella halotolerans TaxID=993414 RepID=UPI00370DA112
MTETTGPHEPAPNTTKTLLQVQDLVVDFRSDDGTFRAVDGISWDLRQGETLAIVGESGSGKSVSSLAVMGLLSTPPAVISGHAVFDGTDLLALPRAEHRRYCGERIAMVFQDALAALNPVYTVGRQLAEPLVKRRGMSRSDARRRAVELLDLVRVPDAANRVDAYPHQFSGGMRQRVMIAMSLALDPDVLIADEPTTALDVTVQSQVLDLLAEIQTEREMAMVLITHDLGVVAGVADRVSVMHGGHVLEAGGVTDIFDSPAHPYTEALLAAVPRLVLPPGTDPDADLPVVNWRPDPSVRPVLRQLGPDHWVAEEPRPAPAAAPAGADRTGGDDV